MTEFWKTLTKQDLEHLQNSTVFIKTGEVLNIFLIEIAKTKYNNGVSV